MIPADGLRGLETRAAAAQQLGLLRSRMEEITRLLEANAPCPHVLHQVRLAQQALHTTECLLLHDHLQVCLGRLARTCSELERQQVLNNVVELYEVRRPRMAATHATQ